MTKCLRFHFVRLAIALLFLFPSLAKAGHFLGASITYAYTGSPHTYLVTVIWYYDCQGITPPTSVNICYNSVSCNTSQVALNQIPGGCSILPNFPYIPPYTSSCNGGSGFGMKQCVYQGLITLPGTCTDGVISYSSFPHSMGQGQNFAYVSTKIDNINYPTNSSNTYTHPPTFLYCVNQPAWNNFHSTDSDGDSLSYHLETFMDNNTFCPPAPFQTPGTPPYITSSTPVLMDSLNGSMTFTPSNVQQGLCAIRVDEFRNGVLINSTTVEHVIFVIANCTITGIETISDNNLQLNPNPANERVAFKWNHSEVPYKVEAIDLSGKACSLKFDSRETGEINLDITTLSHGIYTLRVIGENNTGVARFLVTSEN